MTERSTSPYTQQYSKWFVGECRQALPPAMSGNAVAAAALTEGVACVPGSAFVAPAEPDNALRLCFTHPDADAIIEGVRRLRRAYDEIVSKPRSPGP